MSDGDVMTRLSEANPVRFADLPEGSAETLDSIVARRRPKRRRVLIAAMATMVAAAAAAAAAGAFRGSSTRVLGLGVGGRPSVERPLLSGSQVSLVGASATLGRPIVLPDTSVVSASDAGPVWMNSGGSVTVIAVTFPNAGLWIDYQRGDNYNDDVLLQFRAIARQAPRIFRVIDLRGVPALAGAQNSDQTGTNFGSIEFYAAGIRVTVFGHKDQATLQSIAQSIVDRSAAPPSGQLGDVGGVQLFPYFPPGRKIELADASTTLGAPVVLPDSSLVRPSDAGSVWAERSCPQPELKAGSQYACWIWVSFPSASLSVGYLRPPMYPGSRDEWELQARQYGGAALAVDLDGVAALAIGARAPYPGSVEFDLRGTRIVVVGDHDVATLQAVARSILDRSRS